MATNISSHPGTAHTSLRTASSQPGTVDSPSPRAASHTSSRSSSLRRFRHNPLIQPDTECIGRTCSTGPASHHVGRRTTMEAVPQSGLSLAAVAQGGFATVRTSAGCYSWQGGLPSQQIVQRSCKPHSHAILHRRRYYREQLQWQTPVTSRAGHTVTSALPAGASPPLPQLPVSTELIQTLADTLSKCLGYLVIAGSLFLKVPQILRIVRNKSVQGLSMLSFELECLGFTAALAYCVSKGIPFHVYGELFFILAQSAVLVLLLYHFSSNLRFTAAKIVGYLALAGVLFLGHLPPQIFETIYNFQTTMFTVSRFPQMWTNFKSSSTGELSVTSSLLSVAGCIARLYTSIHERAPRSLVFASLAGLVTNGFLLFQIFIYRPKNPPVEKQH